MNKIMFPATKMKIRRLYTEDGFTKEELLIMYSDYSYNAVTKALRGLRKAEQI